MPGLSGLEHTKLRSAMAEYDFAKDGGAVGDIVLRGDVVQVGCLVVNALVFVETAVTSGEAATVAVKLQTAADLLVATAKASLTANTPIPGIPDRSTAGDMILTTAPRKITATVAVGALTAGKFRVFVEYYQVK